MDRTSLTGSRRPTFCWMLKAATCREDQTKRGFSGRRNLWREEISLLKYDPGKKEDTDDDAVSVITLRAFSTAAAAAFLRDLGGSRHRREEKS